MLHRGGCPFLAAAWKEFHERIAAGETAEEIIASMALAAKGK